MHKIVFSYGNHPRELQLIGVCPECGSRIVKKIKHDTFSYWLCYACDWSSMTPTEIGEAMAKEAFAKLSPLELSLSSKSSDKDIKA